MMMASCYCVSSSSAATPTKRRRKRRLFLRTNISALKEDNDEGDIIVGENDDDERAWMTPKPRHEKEEAFNDDDAKSFTPSSFLDEQLASLFARRLARFMNEEEDAKKMKIDFKRDVAERCVRAVQKSNSEEEQRMFGLAVIESFVPRKAGRAFGAFLRLFPDWFAKRHAAFVTPMLLPWLVGAAEVNDVPEKYEAKGSEEEEHMVPANAFEGLVGRRSQKSGYKQGVLVKRCKVLEQSGCVSVCKNVCKIPTETFFTDVVGLPVTLVPNYETLECQFCYGRVADGTEGEEAGGCYVGCAASGTKRCDETNESTRSFRSKKSS